MGYFNIFQRHPQFYFIQTYLSKIQNIFLQIKLKQFPYFRKIFKTDLCKKNTNLRKLIFKNEILELTSFEDYLKVIIPSMIPTNYIEGYSHIINTCKKFIKRNMFQKSFSLVILISWMIISKYGVLNPLSMVLNCTLVNMVDTMELENLTYWKIMN